MANARGWRMKVRGDAATQPIADSQDISRIAYELYAQRGYEDGHDLEDWLKAEAIVRARRAGR